MTAKTIPALIADAVRLHQAGKLADAALLYQRVLALDPRHVQAHSNLGAALRGLGRLGEAEASYRRAIALDPGFADAHSNLANLLKRTGRLEEALAAYERAIHLKPGDAGLYYNYGTALQEQGRLGDADAAYRNAIARNAGFAEAWSNLGVALSDQGKLEEAVTAQRKAIALKPELIQAHNNLGLVLLEQSRLDEAIASFDQALLLKPDYAEGETNRIFAELYRPGVTLADMLRLSKHWSAAHAPATVSAPARSSLVAPAFADAPGDRPKLGFVSADFREHAVGFLVIPALEGLRKLSFDIVCYNNSRRSDALTARFRAAATIWRDVFVLDDSQLEAQIRADGIGILFDLSGHSRGNRLGVFTRKPAPLQIAWAGYPATTGLTAMDYLLTDRWQTPKGADHYFTEKLLRLPNAYVAFAPPAGVPEPGDLPARLNTYVTFASFNALKKINREVLGVWGRILAALPTARLLLKSPALDCIATRTRMVERFAVMGVDEARLEFLGSTSSQAHVAAMARADIALDTFPYSGGQTSLETLWMGLPLVTWPGETMASRHAVAYLSCIERGQFVADSADSYVEHAVSLARNIDKLVALRSSMRWRMQESPLCDSDRFAADLSETLMRAWRAGD